VARVWESDPHNPEEVGVELTVRDRDEAGRRELDVEETVLGSFSPTDVDEVGFVAANAIFDLAVTTGAGAVSVEGRGISGL
jgi:hypothetical protein